VEITTIRVEKVVRDRLAARAAIHGRSLGAEVESMLREADWQEIEAAYQRLAREPAALAHYRAESEWLAAIDLDELASAAVEEYPEYNS
jgi:plasmid stability protein